MGRKVISTNFQNDKLKYKKEDEEKKKQFSGKTPTFFCRRNLKILLAPITIRSTMALCGLSHLTRNEAMEFVTPYLQKTTKLEKMR